MLLSMNATNRSIRLTDEEHADALLKAESYGLRGGLSAVVRLALKKLKPLTDGK
jgi:hypothetical protein